jgi:hypothetical protein
VNLRRVAPVDWAVGLCGVALIVSLWLPWYRAGTAGAEFHANAWRALAVNDVILLLVGAIAISVVVATATQSSGAVPIGSAVFAAFGGILASILTLVRLIWPPDLGPGPTERAAGVWIGTAAALGIAVTAWLSVRDERRGVEGSTHVEITRLPAPRGEGA